MTRAETYLMLTEALAAAKPSAAVVDCAPSVQDQWIIDCGHVATALGAHHKNFDRKRFLAACGVEGLAP